jgi:prepilin-type N-terminal cleavage/methylation domain-containing protein
MIKCRHAGFTLMELVLVIILISALLIGALYSFSSWKTRAEIAVASEQFYRVYQAMTISCIMNKASGHSEAAISNLLENGSTQISQILPKLNGGSYTFLAPKTCNKLSIDQATLKTPLLSDRSQKTCSGALAQSDPATPCL